MRRFKGCVGAREYTSGLPLLQPHVGGGDGEGVAGVRRLATVTKRAVSAEGVWSTEPRSTQH